MEANQKPRDDGDVRAAGAVRAAAEALIGALSVIREGYSSYIGLAQEHGRLLIQHRTNELPVSTAQLDAMANDLERLEEARLSATAALAGALGMPESEAPARLEALAALLPPVLEGRLLSVRADLREALTHADRLTRRNAALAEAGRKLATDSLEILQGKIPASAVQQTMRYGADGLRNRNHLAQYRVLDRKV